MAVERLNPDPKGDTMTHHLNAASDELEAARDLILLHMGTAQQDSPEARAIRAGLEQLANLIHNVRESLDWALDETRKPKAA